MTNTARADLLIGDLLARLYAAIAEHDVTYEEFQTAKQWLIDVGEAGDTGEILGVLGHDRGGEFESDCRDAQVHPADVDSHLE